MSDQDTNKERTEETRPRTTNTERDSRSGGRTDSSRGDRSDRGGSFRGGGRGNKPFFRKKVCRFCTQNFKIDYRKPESMGRFITDGGKILPRRVTGTCAKHQRMLAQTVKRSRALALLPYSKL